MHFGIIPISGLAAAFMIMTIIDRLVEKKDLRAYIRFRIASLGLEMANEIKKAKPRRKELIKQKFMGRMKELQQLRKILDNLKSQSVKTAELYYALKKC